MLKKFTKVYVDGEEGEWIVIAAWALDSLQRVEKWATYGYEVHKGKRIRVVYDTQVIKIK